MKIIALITGSILMTGLAGCASNNLVGRWAYESDNVSIGLNIKDSEACELSLTRFLAKDAKKDCRFSERKPSLKPATTDAENKNKKQYLLYLADDSGHCDILPDFEFDVDTKAGLLTLLVGEQPFVMQKKK
ncbi:MAG: hypothetical protein U5M23_05190 [Marinagarivorans sp.]|nr:hypothetical protein [Marinagarivorans sp.]